MIIPVIKDALGDGRPIYIGTPRIEDAEDVMRFQLQTATETWFTGRHPADCTRDVNEVKRWIKRATQDLDFYPLFASVGGRLVGAATLRCHSGAYATHRATMSIEVIQDFWGTGVAQRLMAAVITMAQLRPAVRWLELDVYELNQRAIRFYSKYNFRVSSVIPNVLCLEDGTYVNGYRMVLKL